MECSWTQEQTEAIPELTQEQIDLAKQDYDTCLKSCDKIAEDIPGQINFQKMVCGLWHSSNCEASATSKGFGKSPRPAVPPQTYYRASVPSEYTFCLHSKGL